MRSGAFVSAVFAIGIGCCATASAEPAKCRVETLELPVKMVGSRAVATVGINGKSVPLTVDSGAFFSMLTDAAASQLELSPKRVEGLYVEGITGRMDARVAKVDKLHLLGGDVPRIEFIVGGNEPGAGTMGLMGRNLLSLADTEYDLAHGAIRFFFPNEHCANYNMAYWAGSTPVTEIALISDYRSKTPAIRATVKLNGREFIALFDTGATTIVTARAAGRVGAGKVDDIPIGKVYGVGRGSVDGWASRFDRFELGGEAISNNVLPVADFTLDDADLLLGIDFFLSHRIYVSKAQSKMFITYNGGAVFALNRKDAPRTAGEAASDPDATGADALARRGAASAARGDFESALIDVDKASALEPTSAAYHAQRGEVLQALRRPAKAMEAFDKALELDPTLTDAHFRRAALRFAAKDRDGTLTDLDALDRLLAPQAQMRLPMANLYLASAQPARALAQLDRWLPSHESDVARNGALNSRCMVRTMLGDVDRALDDCDDALRSDAKNGSYLDSRGWVYFRMNRDDKALSDFDRSIQALPKSAVPLYGRGLVKTRRGDVAGGEADLAAARALDPEIDRKVNETILATTPPRAP